MLVRRQFHHRIIPGLRHNTTPDLETLDHRSCLQGLRPTVPAQVDDPEVGRIALEERPEIAPANDRRQRCDGHRRLCLAKERLGGDDIAPGNEAKSPRLILRDRQVGTIHFSAADLHVGLIHAPRRPRRPSEPAPRRTNYGAYRCTQRMMVVWSIDRPHSAITPPSPGSGA